MVERLTSFTYAMLILILVSRVSWFLWPGISAGR